MKTHGYIWTCGWLFLSVALATIQCSIAQSSQRSADERQIIAAAQARVAACAVDDREKWVGSPIQTRCGSKENHLFVGSFDDSPTELSPASADTFSTKELESAQWLA